MKTRHPVSSGLTLLPLFLILSLSLYARQARDPQRDLTVSFSSKHEGQDPGLVFGVVKNNSTNAYPCVRLAFDLGTRFDLRPPGQPSKHLGVLTVDVENLRPQGQRDYKKELPFPAGLELKSVSECAGEPAQSPTPPPAAEPPAAQPPAARPPVSGFPEVLSFTAAPQRVRSGEVVTLRWHTAHADEVFVGERNPDWPQASRYPIRSPQRVQPSGTQQVRPFRSTTYRIEAKTGGKGTSDDVSVEVMGTCAITGQVEGKRQFSTKDDRGQPFTFTLRVMTMRGPDNSRRTEPLRPQSPNAATTATYTFTNVPAGQTYRIQPMGVVSDPAHLDVECLPGRTHPLRVFRILRVRVD
jgi:hypothetical protein